MKNLSTKKTKLTALVVFVSLILGTGAVNAAVVTPPNYTMYDTANINNANKWNIMNAHDPEVYKDNGYYYVFSTDYEVAHDKPTAGIQVRRSKDLINWEWVGRAFNGVPASAQTYLDSVVKDATKKVDRLWAPEIVKMGTKFYLYYCASEFGTKNSYIGVATSASITGPWEDQGEVFKTKDGDGLGVNAIDPNIIFDASKQPWLVYGSFFGGIYVNKIDSNTGKFVTYGQGTKIACRNDSVSAAVEGPNMVYNADTKMYYLFTSYDSLNGTYNVRVGRSSSITGPFVDYNGNKLTDTSLNPKEVGTKVLGSYSFNNSDGWIAPGHNSILQDGSNWYMLHHARGGKDTNWAYLQARKLLWTNDGWPVVSPERYAGEIEANNILSSAIVGTWESLVLDRGTTDKVTSSSIKLLSDGSIGTSGSKDHWVFDATTHTLKLYWYAQGKTAGDYWIDTVKVIESWDWENNKKTYVYTGLNQSGTAVWGKKTQ
jgi:arabinan endo-1,5-alpha-L-arabinosidase